MNAGRIEQAGSPREVFNAPRTAFVAQFMGGHNVITTAAAADRGARRPAQARHARRGRRLSATVRTIEYQGTHHQVDARSAGVGELTAILTEAEFAAIAPRPGDGVAVDWNDSDVHPLARLTQRIPPRRSQA